MDALKLNSIKKGIGYIENDTQVMGAFDFSAKNYYPLETLHNTLKRVVFPEAFQEKERFKLSEKSRHAIHHSIDTKITITQIEKSPIYQLDVITDDRHGLLSLISDQLSKEDISINQAKINTLGSRAEDTFLVAYKNNLKMNQNKINDLVEKLKAVIA